MVIALHLGAHKTATTYIQNALELSRDRLNADGIGFVPLRELRSTVTGRLGFGRPGLQSAVTLLLEEQGGCRRLILSDENIIGGLKPSSRGFYAKHRRRLEKLLSSFGQHDVKVYFATRAYDEFISAMYCEYIRHHPFVRPQTYVRGFKDEAFAWSKIIRTFVALLGAENVYLWRHEDFHVVEDQVFAALIDAPADLVETPSSRVRESLSVDAVQSLALLKATQDADELRARAKAAASAYPKGPDNPRFSLFDPASSNVLRARYEGEFSILLQDYPDVHFLTPHGIGPANVDLSPLD